jgi:hypothetical protein
MINFVCRTTLWAIAVMLAMVAENRACHGDTSSLSPGDAVQLFNGKDFDGWYVYTTETKEDNPGVFQAVDGQLYVPGGKGDIAYFGGLITKQSFENYRLKFEYKWGANTFGERRGKARDAGVLLHCTGPNGPSPWMNSYEFQIIEGGTGDLLLVDPYRNRASASKPLAGMATYQSIGGERYFNTDATSANLKEGDRLNWWGRDRAWKDVAGFRGLKDVESPFGEWTRCEIEARSDTLAFYVNGQLVNRATSLSRSSGKLLLQTEGAEIWYRNIELTPLHP